MDNPLHTSVLHSWRGEDDPTRLDNATINLEANHLTAHGTSRTDNYALSWSLTTAEGWVTSRLTATVHGHGFSRHLELERTDDGVWSSTVQSAGECGLPEPGIEDAAALAEALDCDLGLCPVTNTMPMLRLNLLSETGAPADETALTIAWVEVPSLRVLANRQVYSQVSPSRDGEPATVLYSSASRGFTAELVVDRDGVVVDYPGLAKRIR